MNERTRKAYRTLMLLGVILLAVHNLNIFGVHLIELNPYQVASLVSLNTVLFIRLTDPARRVRRVVRRQNGDR